MPEARSTSQDAFQQPSLPAESPLTGLETSNSPQCPPVRPKLSLMRMSSLDRVLAHHREVAAFESSRSPLSQLAGSAQIMPSTPGDGPGDLEAAAVLEESIAEQLPVPSSKFRSIVTEAGFCFSIAMTQLLSEVYISGFALILVNLLKSMPNLESGQTGSFWPAAILSLVISATLLIWARIADMHGGYFPLMFGLLWLTIWSAVPGLVSSLAILNISRAMQGLAIAALMPSVFVLLGHVYKDGRRKNIVIGIYGACAPLGFYVGFVIGGLLTVEHTNWFFFITSGLSFVTMVTAYLSIPRDTTDRARLGLKMDWLGSFLIIAGLMLVDYALAAEPKEAEIHHTTTAFDRVTVLAPLLTGLLTLGAAVWVEGWYASCPLLPFDFFRPRGVKSFCLACFFFYGTFGVWIYNTSEYFNIPLVSGQSTAVTGIQLVLWYTPLVIGGIVFCIVGSAVTKWVPLKILAIISGLAWIGAPLVFAVAPVPLHYWTMILPSMICASLGTDLTFTISNMFLSVSQPQKYQGVAGAVSSIHFNLGISIALPISQIVYAIAEKGLRRLPGGDVAEEAMVWAYRTTFFYAMASGVLGLLICVFCFTPGLMADLASIKDSRASSVSEI